MMDGEAVLVRAVVGYGQDMLPRWVWIVVDDSAFCVPSGVLTTEAAIKAEARQQAFRDAAAMLRSRAAHPSVGNRMLAQFIIGLAAEVERMASKEES